MVHDHIRIGPFAVTLNTSDEEAAASVGEYVADAIDAGVALEEISAAARVAFRHAMRVPQRWPAFGERPVLRVGAGCAEWCQVRRARKSYRCEAGRHAVPTCAHAISAGDYYVEYFGETPAYQSGLRICIPCAQSPNGTLGDVVEAQS